MKLRYKGIIGAASTALLTIAMLVPASAANAAGYSYDGSDPQATGCSTGAYTLPGYPKPIYSPDGSSTVGTYEVRYSPSCGTNWLRVDNYYASGYALVRMIFDRYGASGYYIDDETANGAMWTPQVYAPGSTCVDYEVFVTTNNSSYDELGYINPGLPFEDQGDGGAYKQC